MGYAQLTRTHVTASINDNEEIVQIFVNCELVAYYANGRPTTSSKDLGWLQSDDIVTVQIRGWRPDGSYSVSVGHGSTIDHIDDAGAASHGAPILANRLIREMSMTASGRRLTPSGCQPDARARLPFAASAAGKWNGADGAPFALAAKLASIARWALALVGLLVLVFLGIRDLLMDKGRMTFAKVLFSLEALVAIYSVVKGDLGLAFALCQLVGVCWIAFALYQLLIEDLIAIGGRWLEHHASASGDRGPTSPGGRAVKLPLTTSVSTSARPAQKARRG